MESGRWRLLFFFYTRSINNSPKSASGGCSLLPHNHYWIASKRVVTSTGIISGAGLFVSHAHLDDPGRTEWETKAAAAGGITTLIDMPLNSFPSTVSAETLKLKVNAAKGRIFVNVGFWGGIVPENAYNSSVLEGLFDTGVLGLKKSIANPPAELGLPWEGMGSLKTREQVAELFGSTRPGSTLYKFANGNSMVMSHEDECPTHPRSIVVLEDIFCIFSGFLNNTCELRRHYGLSRQATEAMVIVEAYKVLRDRAPYPADQVIKELDGKFAFALFDAKTAKLFLARDRDGSVQFHWGVAGDGSLVCSDDPKIITEACGNRYTPFPSGCIFTSGEGLVSFDHPLNKVKAILHEDDNGRISAVIFQVDLFTRLKSIPRTGSAANWSEVKLVEAE